MSPDELAAIERKEAQSSAQPTEDDDILTGTDGDDFVVGSVGNDFGQGLAGNDEYFWENKPENSGGSFTVEDTEGDLARSGIHQGLSPVVSLAFKRPVQTFGFARMLGFCQIELNHLLYLLQ